MVTAGEEDIVVKMRAKRSVTATTEERVCVCERDSALEKEREREREREEARARGRESQGCVAPIPSNPCMMGNLRLVR